ncbi:hypothetical protein CYMTET_36129 [Cymbomonas tetramitiformis]|uniref:Uncharacterized protein n=1 Tax=Cymbomonas tetramitiformis TaxID=36881 RepID=A0AAE0F7H2_9CHLO|nr:hypothetical protein CYMTET_36129 [Cymbomonas tetramitiformis]
MLRMPVVHGLGNDFASSSTHYPITLGLDRSFVKIVVNGSPTAAVIFVETTDITDDKIEKLANTDTLLVGSKWTKEVMARRILQYNDRHPGAPVKTEVSLVYQGIDAKQYPHRGPPPALATKTAAPLPFIVFSGGKLEYRKGQDIIIGAFKKFRQIVPEAKLVTAWHSLYPQLIEGVAMSGHLSGELPADTSSRELDSWLARSGLPETAFLNHAALSAPPPDTPTPCPSLDPFPSP